jgi:hypothetical protein
MNARPELYLLKHQLSMENLMAEGRTSNPDFGRAIGDAKKNAADVAGDAAVAAQDVYDSASKAARKTAGSFERALKNTVETPDAGNVGTSQAGEAFGTRSGRTSSRSKSFFCPLRSIPNYTAVAIALGIGWLLGRMHRPL